MASRPVRSGVGSKRGAKSGPKTQAEINRIKPSGSLSLDVLTRASQRVISINVKLPDGEIYQFHHLPMRLAQSEEFVSGVGEGERLSALRTLLTELMVNADGSQFADEEAWNEVDIRIINNLFDAIMKSSQEEGGED